MWNAHFKGRSSLLISTSKHDFLCSVGRARWMAWDKVIHRTYGTWFRPVTQYCVNNDGRCYSISPELGTEYTSSGCVSYSGAVQTWTNVYPLIYAGCKLFSWGDFLSDACKANFNMFTKSDNLLVPVRFAQIPIFWYNYICCVYWYLEHFP